MRNNWITFSRDAAVAQFLDDVDRVLWTDPADTVFRDEARQIWANVSDDWGISSLSGDDYSVFCDALNGESVPAHDIIDICSETFGRSSIGGIQTLLDGINADHAHRMGFTG